MRSRIAAMTRPVCSSESMAHEASCSGDRMSTSWMPPARGLGEHRAPVGRPRRARPPRRPGRGWGPPAPASRRWGRRSRGPGRSTPRCPGRTGRAGWCPPGPRCCGARRRPGARPVRCSRPPSGRTAGPGGAGSSCVSPSRPGRPWPSQSVVPVASCPAVAVSCPLCRPAGPPDDRRCTYGTPRLAPATSTRRAAGPVGGPLRGRRRRPGRGRGVRMGAVPAPPPRSPAAWPRPPAPVTTWSSSATSAVRSSGCSPWR